MAENNTLLYTRSTNSELHNGLRHIDLHPNIDYLLYIYIHIGDIFHDLCRNSNISVCLCSLITSIIHLFHMCGS